MLFELIIFLFILSFALAFIFKGAPYLPVLKNSSFTALDLLDLKNGQTVIDLGSGGGRFLRLAAKNNIKAIGYEINPVLYIISIVISLKYRKNIKIHYGNFWNKKLPLADGLFVFLLPKYMEKLDQKIISSYPRQKIKLVSYSFKLDKREAVASKDNCHLYIYN